MLPKAKENPDDSKQTRACFYVLREESKTFELKTENRIGGAVLQHPYQAVGCNEKTNKQNRQTQTDHEK